jgi:hypothetical protein
MLAEDWTQRWTFGFHEGGELRYLLSRNLLLGNRLTWRCDAAWSVEPMHSNKINTCYLRHRIDTFAHLKQLSPLLPLFLELRPLISSPRPWVHLSTSTIEVICYLACEWLHVSDFRRCVWKLNKGFSESELIKNRGNCLEPRSGSGHWNETEWLGHVIC